MMIFDFETHDLCESFQTACTLSLTVLRSNMLQLTRVASCVDLICSSSAFRESNYRSVGPTGNSLARKLMELSDVMSETRQLVSVTAELAAVEKASF